jgi:four helix bundle protein
MKSYKELEIYQKAFEYFIEIHKLSLLLPKYELYEQGSQLRRAAASIKDNIVEGYGRRKYKQDFIKFLIYSHASLLETKNHLEALKIIYKDLNGIDEFIVKYDKLGAQIFSFINYVEENWKV